MKQVGPSYYKLHFILTILIFNNSEMVIEQFQYFAIKQCKRGTVTFVKYNTHLAKVIGLYSFVNMVKISEN